MTNQEHFVTSRHVAVACSAIAVGVCCIAVAASLSIRGWHSSALVRMSASEPMADLARRTDPNFAFVDPEAHYDGVYFYAIAQDPFARGDAHSRIDRPAYRYGHAGFGWLAWLASAGHASAIPAALIALTLAGAAAAGYAASMLAVELGWTAWGGLTVALTPGVVFAATVDTSEPVALAAVALALLAWMRGRRVWAAVALTAGCFVKEPLLLVPAGLACWEIVSWVRHRSSDLGMRILVLSIGPLLYACWYIYLRSVFGVWPFRQEAQDFLTTPLAGWWDSLQRAAGLATDTFDRMQIGHASVVLITVVGLLLLAGIVRGLRISTSIDPVFVLLALLVLSLNWYGVLYPKDLLRECTVPMALLPAVIAGARRADPGPLASAP